MRTEKLYINGEWKDSATGETFQVLNPADGSLVGKMAAAGKEEVLQAIAGADQALELSCLHGDTKNFTSHCSRMPGNS